MCLYFLMLYDLLCGLHLLAVQTHAVYLHLAYLIITGSARKEHMGGSKGAQMSLLATMRSVSRLPK